MKSAPVRAFQSSFRGGRHMINLRDSEKIQMTSIQTIANSLLEVVEVRSRWNNRKNLLLNEFCSNGLVESFTKLA